MPVLQAERGAGKVCASKGRCAENGKAVQRVVLAGRVQTIHYRLPHHVGFDRCGGGLLFEADESNARLGMFTKTNDLRTERVGAFRQQVEPRIVAIDQRGTTGDEAFEDFGFGFGYFGFVSLKLPKCAGTTVVTMAMCGRAIWVRGVISPR